MRIRHVYSHLNGYEWLMYHHRPLWDEIEQVVESIDAGSCRTKVSEEKGMLGEKKYAPKAINILFKQRFEEMGWRESRVNYWVTDNAKLVRRTLNLEPAEQKRMIEGAGSTAIKSYNQTDFVKSKVAIEVQFGKYAFIAYDLFVKHLAFFMGDKIECGIEILPTKEMQKDMSSGPGYYEGALYDLVRQGKGSPPVPLILLGIEP